MTATVIARVGPADGPVIRDVRLRALAADPRSFGSTYERKAAYPDEAWAEWASGDASGDDTATLLAKRGDEPVGIVAAYRDETEPTVFHIISMWVAPQFRGRGVGGLLLGEIQDWIVSCGGTSVQLFVTSEAEPRAGSTRAPGTSPTATGPSRVIPPACSRSAFARASPADSRSD